MGVVTMLLRGEFRHRWRAWVAGAVLVALVSGLVLAGVATARRTATAFPRYREAHGFDSFFYAVNTAPKAIALPVVTSSVLIDTPVIGPIRCSCGRAINPTDISVDEVAPAQQLRISKLVSGRLPDQSRPDEVLASFTLQHDFGVQVGTVLHVPLASESQRQAVLENENIIPAGPDVALRVVGIEASEVEFPTATAPDYDLYTTDAFARRYNPDAIVFREYFVSLRHGAASQPEFESQARSRGALSFTDLDALGATITASIEPQADGWWILSGLVALVGLVMVFQALLRQAIVESEDYPTLRGLGIARDQLVGFVMIRTAVMACAGIVCGFGIAVGLSVFAPVGEARVADPSPGLNIDPLVLVPGAVTAFVVVVLLGVWPAVRATRTDRSDAGAIRPSRVAAYLSSAGAPPTMLIGVRHALERGRGRTAVPIGSALVGAILAVTALSGTAVFAASLSHLTSTPSLYGQRFDGWFSFNATGDTSQNAALVAAVERPGISAVTMGVAGAVEINGKVVDALAGQSLRGPLLVTASDGRTPSSAHEVVLGASTMRQVGARVGSVVHVTSPSSNGGIRSGSFTVVGTGVFPPDFNSQGLGTGAIFRLSSVAGSPCPSGPGARDCEIEKVARLGGAVLVQSDPGAQGQAVLARVARAYPSQVNYPRPPTNLVNFGEAVNFPLIFGVIVALFGVATLLHFLVVSVARRRRELGILKSLGFVRRQVALSVSWQATTVALIGIVIGVPLGIALGHVVWDAFATNLGVFPQLVVDTGVVALIAGGVLVVANLLAIGPALASARAPSASLLQSE